MYSNNKKSWASVTGILTICFIICVIVFTIQINKATDKVVDNTVTETQETIEEKAEELGIPMINIATIFGALGIVFLIGDIFSFYKLVTSP